MGQFRIGMSGWTYVPWRGKFYPKGLVQKKELEYASRKVTSIEINGTFYSLQRPTSFQNWYDQTPKDFCFAVKGGQYVTHIQRLKEVDDTVANFFASGLFCLKEKLGPILWQFPPNMMLKDDRFEKFLKLLPYTSLDAEKLAQKHTAKVEGRSYLEAGGKYPIRHAFEFRHHSFNNKNFLQILKSYGVAAVFADAGSKNPDIKDITADFVYARMHGENKKYKKGYTQERLKEFAKEVKGWSKTHDVFVYFDTEAKEYAPFDAMNLLSLL